MNALKPDEKIYRLVEEYTKRPSEEHVFIDDTLTNVDGAVKAGWKGIHFTNYENLLEEFKKREIKY
jgi:putative hydrolase of the HAD superfamily